MEKAQLNDTNETASRASSLTLTMLRLTAYFWAGDGLCVLTLFSRSLKRTTFQLLLNPTSLSYFKDNPNPSFSKREM